MDNQGLGTLFEDVMDEGIVLSDNLIKVETTEKAYPDYLRVEKHIVLSIDSKVNPANLEANCAYTYHDNLYLTDEDGNIAYIDCELIFTSGTKAIKAKHPEYKLVGGKRYGCWAFGCTIRSASQYCYGAASLLESVWCMAQL